MSRGFVKDDDDRPERPRARPVDTEHPNYVTPRGLELLRQAAEAAYASGDARNAAYYEARIASAEVVAPADRARNEVAFGSTVTLREESGREIHLQIVGEDEADPAHGSISWISPYAKALLGHRAGERVVVQRPAGAAAVVIVSVESS